MVLRDDKDGACVREIAGPQGWAGGMCSYANVIGWAHNDADAGASVKVIGPGYERAPVQRARR